MAWKRRVNPVFFPAIVQVEGRAAFGAPLPNAELDRYTVGGLYQIHVWVAEIN